MAFGYSTFSHFGSRCFSGGIYLCKRSGTLHWMNQPLASCHPVLVWSVSRFLSAAGRGNGRGMWRHVNQQLWNPFSLANFIQATALSLSQRPPPWAPRVRDILLSITRVAKPKPTTPAVSIFDFLINLSREEYHIGVHVNSVMATQNFSYCLQ